MFTHLQTSNALNFTLISSVFQKPHRSTSKSKSNITQQYSIKSIPKIIALTVKMFTIHLRVYTKCSVTKHFSSAVLTNAENAKPTGK